MTRVRALFVALVAVMLIGAPIASAALGGQLDESDDRYQGAQITGPLTVAEHSMSDMDGPLEYYDDDGEVQSIEGVVNDSQDTPVAVHLDRIEADAFTTFPRVDGENGNNETWANHANWTTSSGASSSMTIADAEGDTAEGVDAVKFTGSVVDTETATGEFSREVDITSDASKRVLLLALNIETLDGDMHVRLVDADGDYWYANASTAADASEDHVIANSTADGIFFQAKLNDLENDTSGGDGALDGIQKVQVVGVDNDVTATVVGLDVERKTLVDVGETMVDSDADGELDEAKTVQQHSDGGEFNLTSVDALGEWASSATLHDLEVHEVQLRAQDLEDGEDYDVRWDDAEDYPAYDHVLNQSTRLSAPSAIDLEWGTLTLEAEQALVQDAYVTVKYATATGDTDLRNVTDAEFTSAKSSFVEKGEMVTIATVTEGENNVIWVESKHTDDQRDALTSGVGGPGPMGGGGGFFSSIWAWIAGGAATIATALGLNRVL